MSTIGAFVAVWALALAVLWRSGFWRRRLDGWRIGYRAPTSEEPGLVLLALDGEGLPLYRLTLEPELAHALSDELLQAAARAADKERGSDGDGPEGH
jgi:hypothetical protein